jgi:hypothetical protein
MITPPDGAGVPSATWKFVEFPGVTVRFAGRSIPPGAGCATVTPAVALPAFGALAVIVTVPTVTPVTGTDTLTAPFPKLTAGGTVATAVSLELRLSVSPAVAGADRFSVRFCVVF